MATKKLYFKCLYKGRKAYNNFQWPEAGKWTSEIKNPRRCRLGYHLTNLEHLFRWFKDAKCSELWLAEARGKVDGKMTRDSDKVAVGKARLVRKLDISRATLYPLYKMVMDHINRMSMRGEHVYATYNVPFSQKNFMRLVRDIVGWSRFNGDSLRNKELKKLAILSLKKLESIWEIDLGVSKNPKVFV